MKELETKKDAIVKVATESIDGQKSLTIPVKKSKKYVAKVAVNIRLAPSMESRVIMIIAQDKTIEVIEEKDEWFRCTDGWTKKEFYNEV